MDGDEFDTGEYRILTEQTQHEIASIASRGLRGEKLTDEEVKRVCGTALHHARNCYRPDRSMRELMDLVEMNLPDVSAGPI